jgi:hypothetical protein
LRIGTMGRVKAVRLLQMRVVYSEHSFAELVLWHLTRPAPESARRYKYRLAYVSRGECVIRYDNEAGTGDHVHLRGCEATYAFVSPEHLIGDFQREIERWSSEDSDA